MDYSKNLSLVDIVYFCDVANYFKIEEWETIKDFPDYKASNLGRLKSLKFGKEKILKQAINSTGRYTVVLSVNKSRKGFKSHQLVAMAFLGHIPNGYKLVIDHKDSIPTNNMLSNLRIVTNRFNLSKDVKNKTSQYTGVYWNKKAGKWMVQAKANGKRYYLGLYESEHIANLSYENFVKHL